MTNNKILLIAPLPPPMTGNSLSVKILYEDIRKENDVDVINLSKNSYAPGINSAKRIFQILKILKGVLKSKVDKDLIYLTISESFAGNIKDLFIYLIC